MNLVQLPVRVTDRQGHTVQGLKKDAFEVWVDDAPQPITIFQGEDAPVTAGIVIDNSASMEPKRGEVIAAALAFARASNPKDQMFVVHFNDHARLELVEGKGFTGNVAELERAPVGSVRRHHGDLRRLMLASRSSSARLHTEGDPADYRWRR